MAEAPKPQEPTRPQLPPQGDGAPRGPLPAALTKGGPSESARKYAWPEAPAVLSKAMRRTDGPDKVAGRAKYTFDIQRPGMLYAKTIRSPHPHATIVSIDLTAALRAPGVRTALNAKPPGSLVMYQGDLVAAVAADTEQQARDAARLVRVVYTPLPFVTQEDRARAPDAPRLFATGNTREAGLQEFGDVDGGFKAAAHVMEATYSTHVVTHVCLESHGAVCEWAGDKLTAWVSTQGVHSARQQMAQGLKIPEANVRVICQHVGGTFGSKTLLDRALVLCAQMARDAQAPVKLMFERKEEHLDTGNRPSAFARIRAGVSADGRVVAFDADSWGTGGAGQGAGFPLPYIYQFPNRRRVHTDIFINAGPQRPMRAPGHVQGSFPTEVLMDELADLAGVDPVEFRIKHLPPPSPNAMWAEYYRMGATRFGWEKRHPTGDAAPGPIKRGMGAAANQWGGGGRSAGVHVSIFSDGSIIVKVGTQDVGTGTRTLVSAITAETLGVAVDAISAHIGDTDFPFAGASGGSATAAGVGPSVRIAAGRARDLLLAKVGPALGVDPASLVAMGGRIHAKNDNSVGMPWQNACRLLGAEPVTVDSTWEPGLSSVNASGVQFAEVTVDIETGIVKATRILAIQDCGLVVNKTACESLIYGGIIASLNFALFEERLLDRHTGQMVNPNMEHYLLAGMRDVPAMEAILVNQPERGIIGIGEPPAVPTAAAVANAVRNAIGVTIRDLPLHPRRILTALAESRNGRPA